MEYPQAEIGVFGGSGFYSLLDDPEEIKIDTPYGAPSSPAMVGEIGGRRVAFIPRHGTAHTIPPHMINYRANVWAMKHLGVSRIIGPCAAGSLQAHVDLGDFVISDQFVDRTSGRIDTFYDGPTTTHVSAADPYCPTMRKIAVEKCRDLGITVHEVGTIVVIQGPRFSTRAESRWFASQGWEVINMTQYPEGYLSLEQEICYVNVALITDHDVGTEGVEPVTNDEVIKVFNANNEKLKSLLYEMIPALPTTRDCPCATALDGAAF